MTSAVPGHEAGGSLAQRLRRIAKRSATTKRQRAILAALEIREPAQILDYELPTPVE